MNTSPQKRGLRAEIYGSKDGHDCSNGGISSQVFHVTIIEDNGQLLPEDCQVFTPSDDAPAVRIVRRTIRGDEYVHIEPIKPVESGKIGYMYGGAIIDCCDSRFSELMGHAYPVHLHDRSETQEQYNMLSR